MRGYGLAGWRGAGPHSLTPEIVGAHAERFFVRGNAVLQLSGPPPAGLRLPLPEGPRPEREPSPIVAADGPRWVRDTGEAGVSMTTEQVSPAWDLAMRVLHERVMATARYERGLSYCSDSYQADFAPGRRERIFRVDARTGQEGEVLKILWATLGELADSGPTEQELGEEVLEAREGMARAPVDDGLYGWAYCELFGLPCLGPDAWLRGLAGTRPEDVAKVLTDGLATALVGAPEDVEPELVDLRGKPVGEYDAPYTRTLPGGRVFRPALWRRLRHSSARRSRLVLTEHGLARLFADGDVADLAFADIVGLAVDGEDRTAFAMSGIRVDVTKGQFGRTGPLVRALDAAVPSALRWESHQD